MYRSSDGMLLLCSVPFLGLRPRVWLSGVPPLTLSTPLASRFFRDSFFSRCSRGGADFRARELAKSGLRGDGTAGTCCSSSIPSARFCGIVDGVELRGLGEVSAMFMAVSLLTD